MDKGARVEVVETIHNFCRDPASGKAEISVEGADNQVCNIMRRHGDFFGQPCAYHGIDTMGAICGQ